MRVDPKISVMAIVLNLGMKLAMGEFPRYGALSVILLGIRRDVTSLLAIFILEKRVDIWVFFSEKSADAHSKSRNDPCWDSNIGLFRR